jgi:hypothetical protein
MEPLTITIETDDRRLSADYMGMARNTAVFDEGGTRLVFQGFMVRKGADVLSDALSFIVEASKSIEFGLLATWLYEKVKNRPATQIVIRRKVVTEITAEGIKRVLKEEIEGPVNRD